MKQKRIELAGLTGTGRTIAEAKASLDKQITAALGGDYSPRLLEYKGRQCIIWRTPEGLVSVYREATDVANESLWHRNGTCHYGQGADFDSAVKSAALNLAMGGCDVFSNELPAIIATWPGVIEDFRRWLGFQRAYRWYKSENTEATESDVHMHACNKGHAVSKLIVFDVEKPQLTNP